MLDRLVQRAVPPETEIAVARSHRLERAWMRRRAGAVHVQLQPIRKPVRVAAEVELDHLSAEHVTVERVGALPVRNGDHDVIESGYSHSMVAGGFDVTSRTTRFTPGISFTIREEISSIRSYGRRAQSAVIASSDVTARITTG